MEIKEYTVNGFINKVAYKNGITIWSRVKNTNTMEITYITYIFKNHRYYKDNIHIEEK